MSKLALIEKAGSLFKKARFGLQKHSPEILIVVGIAGTVTSTVLACIATTKISKIVVPAKNDISKVRECVANEDIDYTQEDATKDLTIIYVQTGLKIAKEYIPAAIVGAISIACLLSSHNILTKRNVALASGYKLLDQAFKEYRKRVANTYGDEAERDIRYNTKTKKITEQEIDPETGEVKDVEKEAKTVNIKNIEEYSPYARFFDETSKYHKKDTGANLFFLNSMQNYANDRLRNDGFLFLNDVYESLGLPKTKTGQIVGWVYKPNSNKKGDNEVDFGISEVYNEYIYSKDHRAKWTLLLDFNVDGNILSTAGLEE